MEAHKWLDTTFDAIGRRSSVDLKARFLTCEPPVSLPPPPVDVPVPADGAEASEPPAKSVKA